MPATVSKLLTVAKVAGGGCNWRKNKKARVIFLLGLFFRSLIIQIGNFLSSGEISDNNIAIS